MTRTPYYHQGFGLPAFRGPALQKGYGLGGLFKGLVRTFAPAIKRGLVTLGRRALKTGVEVLHDYSQGANLKQSVKRRSKENINKLIKSAIKPKRHQSNFIPTSVANKKGRTSAKRTTVKRRKVYDILEDD